MSLLSREIFKNRKLTFRETKKQPVKEEPGDLTPQKKGEPTLGEIYLLNSPILKALAERLDLQLVETYTLLDEEKRYTKKEAINRIGLALDNTKAGERVFIRMVENNELTEIGSTGYYCLSNSTPF